MKSNMTINIDFLAGTQIHEAVAEAKLKAALFDVAYVQFKFNGKEFSIGRNVDVAAAVEDYQKGKTRYGIIHS